MFKTAFGPAVAQAIPRQVQQMRAMPPSPQMGRAATPTLVSAQASPPPAYPPTQPSPQMPARGVAPTQPMPVQAPPIVAASSRQYLPPMQRQTQPMPARPRQMTQPMPTVKGASVNFVMSHPVTSSAFFDELQKIANAV